MPTMTGLVENVDGKYITVNGIKFSAFAPTQIKCVPGENVTFEYVEKPGMNKFGQPVVYKNVKGNVYGKGGVGVQPTPTFSGGGGVSVTSKVGEPILSKDRLILRQNALTAAVNFANTSGTLLKASFNVEDVILIAKKFEAYTSGDADLKEVEDSLNTPSAAE